ncbi:hypothetical protein HZS_1004, partial [Henneguya salminicola]
MMSQNHSSESVGKNKGQKKLMEKVEKFCSEYFGSYARQHLFYIPAEVSFTDQATWGVIPKYVNKKKYEKAEQIETNPHEYLLENQNHDILKVMEAVAKELSFDPMDGVFTNSCSESLQIVLNSIEIDCDDKILILSDCNATISKIIKGTCDKIGCGFDILQVPIPLTKLSILLDLFEQAFIKCKYKLIVMEHISPNSSILYPIDMLTKICKRNEIISIVYGSYAVGHINLDISQLNADFYIGNYKIYNVRKCVSIICASKAYKFNLWPLVENRSIDPADSIILKRFYSDIKCDTVNFLSILYGFDFMNHIGGLITITEYNTKLLRWAVHHIENKWKTKAIKLTRSLKAPFIAFLRVPVCVERYFLMKYATPNAHQELVKHLLGSYEIATCAKIIDNLLYCRITAHIYNTKKDYEILASK